MRWADFGPVTIPPDCYFMMGDNRGNSSDSRVWGPLPVKDVLGKAVCVFWPIVARKPDQPETGLHWGWKLLR
jgi:signal peptidase I